MLSSPATWPSALALSAALASLFSPAAAVKYENFKTCAQSGFCTRNRDYAKAAASAGATWTSPYNLDEASISFKDGTLTGTVLKTINTTSGETVRLPLVFSFLESGAGRITLDEEKRQKGDIELRHGSKARKERYNEVEDWAIVGGLKKSAGAAIGKSPAKSTTTVVFGPAGKHEAIIHHSPFAVDFKRGGETHISLNAQGLMSMEHWRPKVEKPAPPEKQEGESAEQVPMQAVEEGPDESTWWEEKFGGNTDSKPKGPESVAMDFTFHGYEHVYGIPEHTGTMSLQETGASEGNWQDPYRLYNSDVFEYIQDSPMTLYGAIPFMQAHKRDSTVGVFWMNAAETWVDIKKDRPSSNPLSMGKKHTDTRTHWFSESGLIDAFIMLGPTPKDMSETFAELTGYTQLPQMFAIAYHQCRWNYITDQDVRDVDRKFDRHDIPFDVIWLDIEYMDGKKYFTWDPMTFPDPIGMQKQLDEHDRKLVAIIDPHIKREGGYTVVQELESKGYAVKDKEAANPWQGWCWPGNSFWIDCFNPAAIEWWKSLFRYDKFAGTMSNVHIWNDMNEPSVFNGPETTMPKDNIHHGNWEHRDLHNVNGLTFHNATFQALDTRDDPKGKTPTSRPFVLTRSFYAGSQRLGAVWTGDNQAQWPALAASLPMILQNGISGYPFTGADVGGFFGNPDKELLTRWYQAGAFYPFFRAHAHIDTRRREPYLVAQPERDIITRAIRLRYSLLLSWYTAFHTASVVGHPIVKPMWWMHPSDPAGFAIDDQMYIGDTGLLVKPVTAPGETSVSMYLPASDRADSSAIPYYDYDDYTVYASGTTTGTSHTIQAPLEKLPLLMCAGHIFTRRDRPRRSSGLMKHDPVTLVVVLDPAQDNGKPTAVGELYMDDGASYAYQKGARLQRRFVFEGGALRSEDVDVIEQGKGNKAFSKVKEEYLKTVDVVAVERIVIVGAPKEWEKKTKVSVSEEVEGGKSKEAAREADLTWHAAGRKGAADWAVVRAPGVRVGRGWRVGF